MAPTKTETSQLTVEVDGENDEPDDVHEEHPRVLGTVLRDLADHLASYTDHEHRPSDSLEHEQSLIPVSGCGSDSGGVRAVDGEGPEEHLQVTTTATDGEMVVAIGVRAVNRLIRMGVRPRVLHYQVRGNS